MRENFIDGSMGFLAKAEDPETMYQFVNNYNWDDGFDAPQVILDNKHCTLEVALQIFYDADGYSYLVDKDESSNEQWRAFITEVYNRIVEGKFSQGNLGFKVPLTKVQIYKLSKTLSDAEQVFIRDLE